MTDLERTGRTAPVGRPAASPTQPGGDANADRSGESSTGSDLETRHGTTKIADTVVAKIAGMAAREIPGVHEMGGGAARAIGAVRSRVQGQSTRANAGQGVSVEVGRTQAAVDLDLVADYGVSIVQIGQAVRSNVIDRIESMTGLEVTEVNVSVDDLFAEGPPEGREQQREPRVQ